MDNIVKFDRILTAPEVAEYLKISKAKIYYLINRRELPHIRLGRNVRILEGDLIEWLKKNKEPIMAKLLNVKATLHALNEGFLKKLSGNMALIELRSQKTNATNKTAATAKVNQRLIENQPFSPALMMA